MWFAESTLEIIFWSSALIVAYTLFLYPFLIFVLAAFSRRSSVQREAPLTVSLIIPIYNEERVIAEKLANCLALDYPPDQLEIVFASDGSTDRGVESLRRCDDPRVRVIDYPTNRGKAITLNETIPRLKGEIVLLTDASGILDSAALRAVVPHFHDETIGAVCGIYHIFKEGRTRMDSAESTYHGFEMQLRLWEGRIRSTLSGTGALCAFRKVDYDPLPPGVINDDYILPSRIALKGRRVIYEPRARVYDRISTSLSGAFRRRVRIAYGNWQQLRPLKALLNPFRGYLFWVFVSHKLLRMALPFLVLVLFASSWGLAPWIFLLFAGTLATLLVLGLVGLLLDRWIEGYNPLGFVGLAFLNCAAVFVGSLRFLAGGAVKW